MGILDKILGRDDEPGQGRPASGSRPAGELSDEQAIERYRYMLRTAPPEAVEQAHEEAFERLSPEQRRMVLTELSRDVPAPERSAARDDPRSLARLATRAEIRQPGILERTFGRLGGGGGGMGIGMGGLMAGSFLGSIAGVVVGSAIAQSFFSGTDFGDHSAAGDLNPEAQGSDVAQNAGDDSAADAGGDVDTDFGGDFGDF